MNVYKIVDNNELVKVLLAENVEEAVEGYARKQELKPRQLLADPDIKVIPFRKGEDFFEGLRPKDLHFFLSQAAEDDSGVFETDGDLELDGEVTVYKKGVAIVRIDDTEVVNLL